MTLDEYLIEYLGEPYFEAAYCRFWVETVIAAFPFLGPDTDDDLERLISGLRTCYKTGIWPERVDGVPYEVYRIRGTGFWRDHSPLGIKYRCLLAIGSSVEDNDRDTYDWWYGVVTAFQLINLDKDKDDRLIDMIRTRLGQYDASVRTNNAAG